MDNYGRFDIVLDEYLKNNCVSKNNLAEKAKLQRTQLNSYCKNKIRRPDLDVLARICYALNCEITDIIRFTPQPDNIMQSQNREDNDNKNTGGR